ncbi:MAG: hypothetical protein NT013_30775 [Planctomycetia bacterium]|nr:hypothetical protein [Planctomycetia bacterium]
MVHNRPIYHCQCCGSVVRQETFRLPPFCCGHEMVKAGEETLRDDLADGSNMAQPGFNGSQLAPRWSVQDAGHVSL